MTTKYTIRNAHLAPSKFRNFEGRETLYNRRGDRNFVLFLTPEQGHELEDLGANVHWKPDRYNEGELRAQLKVNVKYRDRLGNALIPPKIVMVTGGSRVALDEDSVNVLDTAEIEKTDLSLNLYSYSSPNGDGVGAALKTMYVTIAEDDFEHDYDDVPRADEEAPF